MLPVSHKNRLSPVDGGLRIDAGMITVGRLAVFGIAHMLAVITAVVSVVWALRGYLEEEIRKQLHSERAFSQIAYAARDDLASMRATMEGVRVSLERIEDRMDSGRYRRGKP